MAYLPVEDVLGVIVFASLEGRRERETHMPNLVLAAKKITRAKTDNRENVGGVWKKYEKMSEFLNSDECRNINISESCAFQRPPPLST